jgi:hypothetical protein
VWPAAERPGDQAPDHRRILIILAAAILGASTASTGLAATLEPVPRNNFGSVGLIDMPSARMAPDGELSIGASFFQDTQRYSLGFQALPWLEASFRYSGLQNFDVAYPVYYDRSFAFKARLWNESETLPAVAIGVNDAVGTGIYSGEYVVASKQFGAFDATLGMGWGRLGATALFDNPLGGLVKSFKTRAVSTDAGGVSNIKALFRGPSVGLFGGIVWRTPVDGLSLIAEYSSDKYTREESSGNFVPRGQINLGASYQLSSNITVGLDWLYGRSINGSISLQFDPTVAPFPQKLGPSLPDVRVRSREEQQLALTSLIQRQNSEQRTKAKSKNAFVDTLWRTGGAFDDVQVSGRSLLLVANDARGTCSAIAQIAQTYGSEIDQIVLRRAKGMQQSCTLPGTHTMPRKEDDDTGINLVATEQLPAKNVVTIDAILAWPDAEMATSIIRGKIQSQRLEVEALQITDNEATVYYNNIYYFSEVDALDRLVRILMANTPPTVEKFRLIAVQNGVPQRQFQFLRGPQEREFDYLNRLRLFGDETVIQAPPLDNPILTAAAAQTYPRFSWDIFPQLRQQLFDPSNPLAVQMLLGLAGKLELFPGFSLDAGIETSLYDNFNRTRYSDSALPHVRSDFLQYFARGKTGIGQLDAQYRFRLASDVFAIAKAGYLESMFGGAGGEILWRPQGQRWALGIDMYHVWQRDFDRKFGFQNYRAFTGHVSIYYASPWYNLNFAVRTGQYLAGDRGFTMEVTRRFKSGIEIGVFATKTNISAAEYGEGSFDKGILIRIPLGWMAPIETQGQFNLDLRPVQRDGGQRLLGDALLYEETRRTSLDEILLQREGFAE